jgi:type IV secretory pathway TrbF-like protein
MQRRNRILSVALLLSLVSHGVQSWGLAQAAARPGAVPFQVNVDRLGQVQSVGPLEPLPPPGEEIIRPEIINTIGKLRTVYADPIALNDVQIEARGRLCGEAIRYVDRYFGRKETNPYNLAGEKVRRVDVTNVLRMGGESESRWKVEWVETEYPLGGAGGGSTEQAWGGVITVTVERPRTEAGIYASPYGICISELDWRATSAVRVVPQDGGQQ